MFVNCSLIFFFILKRQPTGVKGAGAGDDVEESFYLDGPRSRMCIGAPAPHVDSSG